MCIRISGCWRCSRRRKTSACRAFWTTVRRTKSACARALINDPALLLADEPTGNLDRRSADDTMELLRELNRQGCTILLVTHEERYADMCSRKIRMTDGCAAEA